MNADKIKLPAKAIHHCPRLTGFVKGEWHRRIEDREVIISAMDKTDAIVRRKGCNKYICPISELEFDLRPSAKSAGKTSS